MVVLLKICFFPTLVNFSDFNWERFEFTGCMCVLTIQVIFVCSFMIVASFKMGNFCWLLNLLFYCYSTFLSDFIYVLLCHEIGWIHSICVCTTGCKLGQNCFCCEEWCTNYGRTGVPLLYNIGVYLVLFSCWSIYFLVCVSYHFLKFRSGRCRCIWPLQITSFVQEVF